MRFTYKNGKLSQVRGITRLKSTSKNIGNVSVFYGLYEIELDSRRVFAVSVADDDVFRLSTGEKSSEIFELYQLVSENEVDTVSFDGIVDDFMYSSNNIL